MPSLGRRRTPNAEALTSDGARDNDRVAARSELHVRQRCSAGELDGRSEQSGRAKEDERELHG